MANGKTINGSTGYFNKQMLDILAKGERKTASTTKSTSAKSTSAKSTPKTVKTPAKGKK